MLSRSELWDIARTRLKDADVLVNSQRYHGAIYVCGYAVELALKAKICRTLKWKGYPSTRAEFQDFQTFRTHNLDVLLKLSGAEDKIKTGLFPEWSAVANWEPDVRYQPVGSATKEGAKLMIDSASRLLAAL